MPPDIRRLCRRLFHSIVTHFFTDANNIFAFFENILTGLIKIACILAANFQNPENTGRSSFPAVPSHRNAPAKSPAVHPGRRSPRQIPNPKISHPQKAAITKIRSERPVHRGRRGRKNPYSSPKIPPIAQAARKCRTASAGAVIGPDGSTSRPGGVLRSSGR